jgi:hypothetical protein
VLKVFFRINCPRDWLILKVARVQAEQELPALITLGLRFQETLNLQIAGIQSCRCHIQPAYNFVSTGS